MKALTDPPGSAFKVSESRVRGAVAWSETGLQEPQTPILAVNFVIEANQDGDELPVGVRPFRWTASCCGFDQALGVLILEVDGAAVAES